eukprot:TRINITY_DN713_c0_g1_i1.p1 TRINITY_DN713_c0_g1~~TRINITY_DN713_c0_g1_i1.p1  ORF type:complete len:359 (+),score=37.65 TRINITY_DN713_c0_g1_i1:229-1305(+)
MHPHLLSLLGLLCFALLVAAQRVSPALFPQPNDPDIPGGMTDADVFCSKVGLISGCAACNYGTFGMCRYVLDTNSPLDSFCVSVESSTAFTSVHRDFDNSLSACSESYLEESFLSIVGSDAASNIIRESRSHAHSIGYCDFPEEPWVVDRTSYLQLEQVVHGSSIDVCESVNSPLLHQLGRGALPGCTLENDYDKVCLSLWLSMLCTSRCPQYGRPTSGFCKEDYALLESACSQASIVGRCVPPAELVEDAFIGDSADGQVQLCSSAFEIAPTDLFEADFGFFQPCEPSDCHVLRHEITECDFPEPCEEGTKDVIFAVNYEGCGGKSCPQVIAETFGHEEERVLTNFPLLRFLILGNL